MLLVKPEKIYFEDQNDVIDYVAKGLPPRKKDLRKVMNSLGVNEKVPNEPYIGSNILNIEKDDLKAVLNRVYEDNKKNYMIGAGIAVGTLVLGVGLGLLIGGGSNESSTSKTVVCHDDDIDEYIKFYLFILFLAVLGLRCGAWASHCCGFSCNGA